MRPGEEFDDANMNGDGEGSNTKYEVSSGSVDANRLPDKILRVGCLVIHVEESETKPTMSDKKDDQNRQHDREITAGCLVINVEESETIPTMSDQNRQHEGEIKESIVEEVNKREAETSDADEVAVETQIASDEVVVEEEVLAENEVLAEDEVLLPDLITPSMILIIFNVILPTVDIFLDTALVQKLFLNGYWGCGVFVTSGILTNFLFSSLAWWRMEPAEQKKWSWILLVLQLWPQLKAFQVQD